MKRETELTQRVKHFEDVDRRINIKSVVEEKNNYQNTYRSLTKMNIQNRLQLDSQRRLINSKCKFGPKYGYEEEVQF